MTAMRSVHCGGPGGVAAHRAAGEDLCAFCARMEPAEPPPHRYYLAGGVLIGTAWPNEALCRLLDTGQARELTTAEARRLTAGRSG